MAIQIVMDHNGDTRHYFDANDAKALLEAEERFVKLTGAGFTAAVRTASGEPAVTRNFDPAARGDLVFPKAGRRLKSNVRAVAERCRPKNSMVPREGGALGPRRSKLAS